MFKAGLVLRECFILFSMLAPLIGHLYFVTKNKMSDNEPETEQETVVVERRDSESSADGEEAVAIVTEEKQHLDDDLDRRNPQYIPKGGAFYEHDNRTLDDEPAEEVAETEKKKKMWKESKTSERWLHDQYVEAEQGPKSSRELIDTYGYDIRIEENAPRARRRRKYGRGPEKYDRKWDDEQAYGGNRKPNGRKRPEDFPPLQNENKGELEERPRPPVNTAWRGPVKDRLGPRNAPPASKSMTPSPRPTSPKPNKSRSDDHIKPFRTEANRVHEPRARAEARPITKGLHEITQSMAATTIQSKPKSESRGKESAPVPLPNQPTEQPVNRQNPKRYSKLRKNFQGYFTPDEIPELDPREAKAAMELSQTRAVSAHLPPQRQQDILVPSVNVMPRYPDQYNGNAAYLPGRTILQTIAQPGLSPQGALPQNLSPQLAAMEMQPQPGFVPPPVYITPEVLNFPNYPAFPPNQNREVYQASSGITYYSPEVQAGSVQPRSLPQRRKAAIPIMPPPENQ